MQTWSIFCRVVDNFGDIGVCWRLARQLSQEHGFQVTLWVDDLVSFAKIRPEIDAELSVQSLDTVTVRLWPSVWQAETPSSDVVLETFACELPPSYIEQMRQRAVKPVWINLDYLSAEDWVSGCHGLPSPQNGLSKYFFFPGFHSNTGGLLAEQAMRTQRANWSASDAVKLRAQLAANRPAETASTLFISLFAYENPALAAWLLQLKKSPTPIHLFVPEGKVLPQIQSILLQGELHIGGVYQYGAVSIAVLPMLTQDQYDQLLWSCDLNFVRGEDSFVRAQWAGLPMIWHIYPQADFAHLEKLEAFLQLYLTNFDASHAKLLRDCFYAWNQADAPSVNWIELNERLAVLQQNTRHWMEKLGNLGDLATNLVKFTQSKLK